MKKKSLAKDKVLDSSAVLAYFEGGTGCQAVTEILQKSAADSFRIFISAANWAEVLSVIERRYGAARRGQIEMLAEQMSLDIVPVDKALARLSAHLNASFRLHYLDAFAAALTISKEAELVTRDLDFKLVERELKIFWL